MDIHEYKGIVEGLLFAVGEEGINTSKLRNVLEVEREVLDEILDSLKFDYSDKKRGLALMSVENIVYMTTKAEHAPYLKQLLDTPHASRLSQAALETLAIIAYQQPITRSEIEELRGVKSERAIQTLTTRSLIQEVGRKEGIGRPILYGTTKEFLTYFGISSLEDLPPLPEGNEEDVEAEADLFFEEFKAPAAEKQPDEE
ncbi:segregation and condensation protein B [Thalassobacillus devorans]|uniref:Segregation and condensation protein B n=1 Tax=Thalassobacillus devorans TaxID=279813 RepID=A0ABQ1NX71_9BACI|nr:SMC-Scp complex subunit ScpB [Thalassobacillus devorans]NIK28361.1 segregation and condensation protein B [Thalassobacillus devorans]GGC86928.1 segregation and condensation protein B [Thalassobacillus devorans]